MTRLPRPLRLALLTVGMIAAVAAPSSALAQFEVESTPALLTMSSRSVQEFQASAESVTVQCHTIKLVNTVVKTTPTTTILTHPEYSDCTKILGETVTVTTTGCDYDLRLPAKTTTGTMDIACTGGATITVTVGNLCKFHIGSAASGGGKENENLGSMTYSNFEMGKLREVSFKFALTAITSTRTGSILCGPATSTTGTYSGTMFVIGEKTTSPFERVGFYVD
ncbi:MAG: hypothetical protein QOF06_2262 [Solirubrobacterales bacterium]|jgi:uncharacterized YccA/Bax inhibitor family protein|nr:hypothetical protein [Solirubrobacterales bacterium]